MNPRAQAAVRRGLRSRDELRVALCVPTQGSAGLWGPSAIACAQLAAEEIERDGGVRGRRIRLEVFNASDEAEGLHESARAAIDAGEVDAIVGMHTSSVRQRLKRSAEGRVPFVYTPLYEGGEAAPGVYTIGERPELQLRPAIGAMAARYRCRRWLLLGNDYVWPRVSHRLARQYVQHSGGEVLDDLYLPFGVSDFGPVLERLARLAPDCILLSLIGQDAVDFNRLFAQQGLDRRMLRLSCAFEENGLLAIGQACSEGLHVAAGYFAGLGTEANLGFKERYHGRFGQRAPMLNALGQSTYEGVHFVAALAALSAQQAAPGPMRWRSVRGTRWQGNAQCDQPVYLARADGHRFEVLQPL